MNFKVVGLEFYPLLKQDDVNQSEGIFSYLGPELQRS